MTACTIVCVKRPGFVSQRSRILRQTESVLSDLNSFRSADHEVLTGCAVPDLLLGE